MFRPGLIFFIPFDPFLLSKIANDFYWIISGNNKNLKLESIPGSKTRTELPSCEAIDVKKVSIGNIVLPGNKFKAGTNLRLLPT